MSETVEVPFRFEGNRMYLTDQQIEEEPYLRDFVTRFDGAFEHDEERCVWWLFPEDAA